MRPLRKTTSRGLLAGLFFVFLCLTLPAPAQQNSPTTPILRVETGMHGAAIGSLSTDAQGRYVVTGSDDKTVRVWNARTGAALRVLRPPIGAGDTGKIFAVALSPDGNTIACGGRTGAPEQGAFRVYLFERNTGRMTGHLDNLPNAILSLAYSPDGRYLAVGLAGGSGIRLYRTPDYAPAGTDSRYGTHCYGLAWARVGSALRLATTSFDQKIRLYSFAEGGGTALHPAFQATIGALPYSAAFSPDGTKLAVGFYDRPQVMVLSGTNLSTLVTPDFGGMTMNDTLFAVGWSADGTSLYAGGKFKQPGTGFALRRWANGGQGDHVDVAVTGQTIFGLQTRPAGGVFFCAGDPAWGAVGTDDRRAFWQGPQLVDFQNDAPQFLVSRDGGTIQFGTGQAGNAPAQFSLAQRLLATGNGAAGNAPASGLSAPITKAPGVDVTGWRGTRAPCLNTKELPLELNELARSLALAPDGNSFLLGTEWNLRCFGSDGRERWHVAAPGTTWAVNVAGNGRTALAAFGDGTIRWFRMADGKPLCSLFPHADGKRWLLWTPGGYYDCSPGGEDFIGWHVNNGPDRAADFFPAGRFRRATYRPDVLHGVLGALDPVVALQQADIQSGRQPAPPVQTALPPVVTILSPQSGESFASSQVTLRYSVRTPTGEPVTAVRALIDGRPAQADRDLRLVAANAIGTDREITVTIPPHDCVISLIAESRTSASEAATVRLAWAGTAPAPRSLRPRLFVLAVGISKYKDPDIALTYPNADARTFSQTMLAQKGRLYDDVQERVLLDGDATRDKIREGLIWIKAQTTPRDVAVIFLAGHGANDPAGNYLFVPADFDRDRYETTGVPFSDIKSAVENLAGKTLLFVDSCHSGNVLGGRQAQTQTGLPRAWCPAPDANQGVDVTGAVNELSSAENGAIVFTASTGRQVALEDPAWGHGAFTKALVEGLTGKADFTHRGQITVNMLDLYLSDRVKELTHGAQTPTTAKPQTVPDFPVALSGSP